ncbi:hypothetical protein [Acinetobacter brisouii]|uniref:hypothetical protein n=1 Tax=Acinetobacter brisouii TaxID=396323 RepID=UPI00124D5228|nr:hypothetical protein [Acinetobacter brisouii]
MKMNISSVEKHQRQHIYCYQQEELKRLAIERVAQELGIDLTAKNLKIESRLLTRSNGINPTTYECEVSITEILDCKD